MKYLIVLLSLVVNSSLAFANTKALEKCVAAYALTAVEEFNSPNQSVIAETQAAKDATVAAFSSLMRPELALKYSRAFANAQAIGLIIQYGDEIELIYVGVNIVGGQCQVTYADSLNTVDVSGEETGLTPADAAKFYLNYSKQEMMQLIDPDFAEIYEIIEENLAN